jgi:hypothetical protein
MPNVYLDILLYQWCSHYSNCHDCYTNWPRLHCPSNIHSLLYHHGHECPYNHWITFTSTVCPATVVSGTTYSATTPASVSATTTSTPSVPTTPVVPPSTLVTSTQGGMSTTPKSTPPSGPTTPVAPTTPTGPSATPSPPASVGDYDFEGCYGSKDGFKSFTLIETSAEMTVELCVSECKASGDKYAGLYKS